MNSNNRLAVFVDGANFFYMQKNDLNWFVDTKKLLKYCERFGDLVDAYYYVGKDTLPEAGQPAPAAGSPEAAAADASRRQEAAERDKAFATLLARVQPDWLFVLDRGAATGGEPVAARLLAAHPAIQRTPAWSRQQVVHLDPPGWYLVGGGYGVLDSTIAQVGKAFDSAR